MTPRPVRNRLRQVKTVTCSCGYVALGETADELLADVEAHIDAVHRPEPAVPAPITTSEAKQ
jgi:predicted small metal-binding protein